MFCQPFILQVPCGEQFIARSWETTP